VTLAALAAGCGGGPSHADFVRRADAICTAYVKATKAQARPHAYAQIVAWVGATLPLYEAALRKLEALDAPSGDRDAVRSWLAADRRVAQAVHDLGDAAERRDFPGVTTAASRAELAGSQSRRAATALGLRVCGQLRG
jgi:hypothetical protein